MTIRTDLSDVPMTDASAHPAPHARRSRLLPLSMAIVGVLGIGVLGYAVKGSGVVSKVRGWIGLGPPPRAPLVQPPLVLTKEMSPRDCFTGIDPNAPIILPLTLPNGPIDPKTLTD